MRFGAGSLMRPLDKSMHDRVLSMTRFLDLERASIMKWGSLSLWFMYQQQQQQAWLKDSVTQATMSMLIPFSVDSCFGGLLSDFPFGLIDCVGLEANA